MYKFISFYCVMCAFVILSCTKEQAPDFLGVYPGQNFSDAENVLIKNNFVFQADQVGNFYVGKYEGTEADVQLSYELDKTISSVSVNMLYDKNNVAKRRFNKILRNLESKCINFLHLSSPPITNLSGLSARYSNNTSFLLTASSKYSII